MAQPGTIRKGRKTTGTPAPNVRVGGVTYSGGYKGESIAEAYLSRTQSRGGGGTPQKAVVEVSPSGKVEVKSGELRSIAKTYKQIKAERSEQSALARLPLSDRIAYSLLKKQGKAPQITPQGIKWSERNRQYLYSAGLAARGRDLSTVRFNQQRAFELKVEQRRKQLQESDGVANLFERTGYEIRKIGNNLLAKRGGKTILYARYTNQGIDVTGYERSKHGSDYVFRKGDRKVIVTPDGRIVGAPEKSKINVRFIPTPQQQKVSARLELAERKKFVQPVQVYVGRIKKINNVVKDVSQIRQKAQEVAQVKKGQAAKAIKKGYQWFKDTTKAEYDFTVNLIRFSRNRNSREAAERLDRSFDRLKSKAVDAKNFAVGFFKYPYMVAKGIIDISRGTDALFNQAGNIALASLHAYQASLRAVEINERLKAVKAGRNVVRNRGAIAKEFQKYKNDVAEVKKAAVKASPDYRKAVAFYTTEEAKLAIAIAAITGLSYAAILSGGFAATAATAGLEVYSGVLTVQSVNNLLKNPTAENLGDTLFFALPYLTAGVNFIRKLSPNTRPTVKDVRSARKMLMDKIRYFERTKRTAIRLKKLKIAQIAQREIINSKKYLSYLNTILRDKRIIQLQETNPIVQTKYLQQFEGAVKDLYHVSGEPKINKLIGQIVERKISEKQAVQLLKGLEVKDKGLKGIKGFTQKDRLIIDTIIANEGIVYGGKAVIFRTPFYKRLLKGRITSRDYDVLVRNPRKVALQLRNLLNKTYKTKEFNVVKRKPKTAQERTSGLEVYKLRRGKEPIADFTNIRGRRVRYSKDPVSGLRVATAREIIKGKLKAALTRGKKQDIKDLGLFGIKRKDYLPKGKNPSNVFEVARQGSSIGADRLRFNEDFLYVDLAAALVYSYGKPYSILIFEKAKISKVYSPSLQARIERIPKMSQIQKAQLRLDITKYINNHPGKFFVGSKNVVELVGESQFVASVLSKSFKKDVYRTWDNDFRGFMQALVLTKGKQKSTPYLKKLKIAYAEKPFQQLKLRLTNPDILKVRRFRRLINKKIPLNSRQERILDYLFYKLIKPAIESLKSKARAIITALNKPRLSINLKPKYRKKLYEINQKLKVLGEPVIRTISTALRKFRKGVRVSGQAISKPTLMLLNKTRGELGNLNIRYKITRYNVTQEIMTASRPIIKAVNRNLRKLKLQVSRAGGVVTAPILKTLRTIRNYLRKLNIEIRFRKYRIGERLSAVREAALRGAGRPVRLAKKGIRVSGEAISGRTEKAVLLTREALGNLNIKYKFSKYRAKEGIKNASSGLLRLINRRLRELNTRLRATRYRIIAPILKIFRELRRYFGQLNIEIKFKKYKIGEQIRPRIAAAARIVGKEIRKGKRVVRLSGEAITGLTARVLVSARNELGNLNIRFKFSKYRLSQKIRSSSRPIITGISRNIRKLKLQLRRSRNVVTAPILRTLRTIRNYFRRLNIDIKYKKYRIGERITEISGRVARASMRQVGKAKRISRAVRSKVARDVRVVDNALKNLGLSVRFVSYKGLERISSLRYSKAITRANRLVRILKAGLRRTKGRITRPLLKIIKKIERTFPFEIRIIRRVKAREAKRIKKVKKIKKPKAKTQLQKALEAKKQLRSMKRARRKPKVIVPRIKIRARKKPTRIRTRVTRATVKPIRMRAVRERIRKPETRIRVSRTRKRTVARAARTTTRARKTRVRQTVRVRPIRIRSRSKKRLLRVPVKAIPKETKIPRIITWNTKLKRGYSPAVNIVYRKGGRNRILSRKTTPNRAIKLAKQLIDNTTSRSFQLVITGIVKRKDIPKQSLKKFRLRKGKDPQVLKFVEKSRYAIDTSGEKRQLRSARRRRKR